MATAQIRVELLRSAIGFDKSQKLTLLGLGLRKRHHVVTINDTPSARGQIYKVRHLVRVLDAKDVKKPFAWKGAVVVPGPRTAPAEKKAKAVKGDKKKAAKKSAKTASK